MLNPLGASATTSQTMTPPAMLSPSKTNAERRGLIQAGMNEAQAMTKAANNQTNQFFAKGGSTKEPTRAEDKAEQLRRNEGLEASLNNSKADVLEAFKDPTLRRNWEIYDDPTPKKKPRSPRAKKEEYKDESNGNELFVPYNMPKKELRDVLDEVAPIKDMNKGGIMKYASGGAPPGALPEEIEDDIPAKLSEGEFVFSADATRYWGLKTLMEMVRHARHELHETEEEEEDEHYPVDELGQFIHPPADMDAYEDKEFGPEFAKGGATQSFFDGGYLDNDIQYARGGLMKKIPKKEST